MGVMQLIRGTGIHPGIAIGRIRILKKKKFAVERIRTEDVDAQIRRFEEAGKTAMDQLAELGLRSAANVGRKSP